MCDILCYAIVLHCAITNRSQVKQEINELEQLLAAAGQTSQSTLLLKKRKEMREVDESLEQMKMDYKKRMDICEERRLAFELRQSKMREEVLKLEKFIHENDAKRQRAEAKFKTERKMQEEKDKEIAMLQEKIQALEKEQKFLSVDLMQKSCFKTFLEGIIEDGDHGYEEITEILNRHTTLVDANRDLMQHSEMKIKEMDEFRKKLQSLQTESENIILVSTGVMQRYQLRLEKIRNDVKGEEHLKLTRENKAKHVSREGSQSGQSIKNLFGRCVSTMRIKPVFSGNKETATANELVDYELDLIKMRISDLVEISKDYKYSLEHTQLPPIPNLNEGSVSSGQSGVNNNNNNQMMPAPAGGNGALTSKSLVSK